MIIRAVLKWYDSKVKKPSLISYSRVTLHLLK